VDKDRPFELEAVSSVALGPFGSGEMHFGLSVCPVVSGSCSHRLSLGDVMAP
jgi:hypothetical protein